MYQTTGIETRRSESLKPGAGWISCYLQQLCMPEFPLCLCGSGNNRAASSSASMFVLCNFSGRPQVSLAFSIVNECGGNEYRSFFPSAPIDRCTVFTVVLLKSFSALISGPFTSETATVPVNCLS